MCCPAVLRARDGRVLFDIGQGSFSFLSAEALVSHGFWPDTILTDLHQGSLPGPNLMADQEVVQRVRDNVYPI